jgi:hypothetical protein
MAVETVPTEERVGITSLRWTVPLAFAAFATSVALLRYHVFLAGGFDLGLYQQGLWALWHEGLAAWSSWGGYPVLARGASWVLLPLAPLYVLFGVGFLLLLQAFFVGTGYLFLFDWLAERGAPWAAVRRLGWLYLLNPVLWGATLFDFHPLLLAVPALLAAISLAERGRYRGALGWGAVALASHVLAVLPAAAAGVVWLVRRRVGPGLAALGLAAAVLAVDLAALARLDPHGPVILTLLYGQPRLPAGWLAHVSAALTRPSTWVWLGWLLGPFAVQGWPGRGALWLVALVPWLLLDLSATLPAATDPFTQLAAPALVPLFLAWAEAPEASAAGSRWWPRVALTVAAVFFFAFLAREAGLRHQAPATHEAAALAAAVAAVPPGARVYCQDFVAPHLADRAALLPVRPGVRFAAPGYVVLDTQKGTAAAPLAAVRADAARLRRTAVTVFDQEGVLVFRLVRTVEGV